MEVWKIAFHSIIEIFHFILASSIFHTEISVPFHSIFHSVPCPAYKPEKLFYWLLCISCLPKSYISSIAGRYLSFFKQSDWSQIKLSLLFANYTEKKKRKRKYNHQLKNLILMMLLYQYFQNTVHSENYNFMEYWLEYTEKLKSLPIKMLPRLFKLGNKKTGSINYLNDRLRIVNQQSSTYQNSKQQY